MTPPEALCAFPALADPPEGATSSLWGGPGAVSPAKVSDFHCAEVRSSGSATQDTPHTRRQPCVHFLDSIAAS